MRDVVITGIGLIGGILLSIIFWYITMHKIIPSVEFSTHISKRYATNGVVAYEFRIRNRSSIRGIVDLQVSASLRVNSIPMWRYSPGTEPLSVPIPIEVKKIAFMRKRDGFRVLRIDLKDLPSVASIHHRHALQLHRFPGVTGDPLEYLFKTGTDSYLTIDLLAYDAWTGARKYFQSPRYTIDDVINGKFNKNMEVEPFAVPEGPEVPVRLGGAMTDGASRGRDLDPPMIYTLLILAIWLIMNRRGGPIEPKRDGRSG